MIRPLHLIVPLTLSLAGAVVAPQTAAAAADCGEPPTDLQQKYSEAKAVHAMLEQCDLSNMNEFQAMYVDTVFRTFDENCNFGLAPGKKEHDRIVRLRKQLFTYYVKLSEKGAFATFGVDPGHYFAVNRIYPSAFRDAVVIGCTDHARHFSERYVDYVNWYWDDIERRERERRAFHPSETVQDMTAPFIEKLQGAPRADVEMLLTFHGSADLNSSWEDAAVAYKEGVALWGEDAYSTAVIRILTECDVAIYKARHLEVDDPSGGPEIYNCSDKIERDIQFTSTKGPRRSARTMLFSLMADSLPDDAELTPRWNFFRPIAERQAEAEREYKQNIEAQESATCETVESIYENMLQVGEEAAQRAALDMIRTLTPTMQALAPDEPWSNCELAARLLDS